MISNFSAEVPETPEHSVSIPPLLSRERAILEFNRRVLAQAHREDVPILERLRYICIVSSNMDEFFEVRFADYIESLRQPGSGASLGELAVVAAEAHAIIDEQYATFNDEVMPRLQRQGIVILNHADRDKAQCRWVSRFFAAKVIAPPQLIITFAATSPTTSPIRSCAACCYRRMVRRPTA